MVVTRAPVLHAWLRRACIGPLFLIPLLPSFVADALYFPFITGRTFVFRLEVECAFAAWLALCAIDRDYRPRRSLILTSFGALVAWMTLADCRAEDARKALVSGFERMDGWLGLVHVFAFFLVAASVLGAEQLWRRYWLAFAAASSLVCASALLQCFGYARFHGVPGRADASLGNPAYLAGYLLFALPTTVFCAFESRRMLRATLFALACVQGCMIACTGTRAALVAAIVASVVSLATAQRPRAWRCVAIAAAIVASAVIVAWASASAAVRAHPTLVRLVSLDADAAHTRSTLWRMASAGIAQRPLLGWGHEGFVYVFERLYDPALCALSTGVDRAHNALLDAAIAGGVPAAMLQLSLWVAAFMALRVRPPGISAAERSMLIFALTAYCVQALFVFDHIFTSMPLTAALARVHGARSAVPGLAPRPVHKLVLVACAVLALASFASQVRPLVSAYWLGRLARSGTDLVGDLALARRAATTSGSEQRDVRKLIGVLASNVLRRGDVPDSIKQQYAALAIAQLRAELRDHASDTEFHALLAELFQLNGDVASARAENQHALKISPRRQPFLIQAATLQWQIGDRRAAAALFQRAQAIADCSQITDYVARLQTHLDASRRE